MSIRKVTLPIKLQKIGQRKQLAITHTETKEIPRDYSTSLPFGKNNNKIRNGVDRQKIACATIQIPRYSKIGNYFQMKTVLTVLLLIVLATSQNSPKFTLSFNYAARTNVPLDSSQIEVLWNNNIVTSVLPVDYLLHVVTLSVTANIGSNVLSFAASGKSDGLGSDIGNVQLIRQGTTNNIVINGDFSIPNQNGKWKIYNGAINGWSGSQIEIGRGTIYNSAWPGQICQLDGNHNDAISQTFNFDTNYNLVSTTPAPACADTTTVPYTLQFDWAPRTNGISNLQSSQANVWLNNLQVANLISAAGNSGINHFTVTVQLTKCNNVLQFDGTGLSDGYGVTVSNVKLYSALDSTNIIVNGDFSKPALAAGTWKTLNGGIPGWAAASAQVGSRKIYNNAWSEGQCIELDTSANTRYTQVIALQQVRSSTLGLSFSYAARSKVPLGSSQIEVVWNNVIVSSIVPTDYNIHSVVVPLTINPGANVLSFAGAGLSDALGSDISSVSLIQQGTNNNLVVNGDFSQPSQNGGWSIRSNIPGWTGPEIQVGQGSVYNAAWKGQICELDGNHNDIISQTLTFDIKYNLTPNADPATCSNTATQSYNLQFDWAPRTNGISKLESSQANVWFNSDLVASLIPTDADKGVNHFSGNVAFSACINVLSFDGTGVSDSFGITISNVQLFAPASTTNLIVNGNFASPALAAGTWKVASGGIPGWSANNVELGRRTIYNSAWSDGQCIQLDVNSNTRYSQTIRGPSASHQQVHRHLLYAYPSS